LSTANATNGDNVLKEGVLLQLSKLKKFFPVRKGILKRVVAQVKAVDEVDMFIKDRETLGLVGESGCGKTTVGRTLLRLIEPTSGDIYFKSRSLANSGSTTKEVNVAKLGKKELKLLRRDMQIIFQDPYSSLNPRMTVGSIIGEPLLVHGIAKGSERDDRVRGLLGSVGLKPDHMKRYPHEFSGGQRQRIGVARALALSPQLIVADEPVSALDVSVQAQVLNLLKDLQGEFGLTYLFIAHDMAVIKHISDRVAVMYLGKIVELAETGDLFANPRHPYTEALMSAVPIPNPDYTMERILLAGDVPSPVHTPSGCYFHPRCQYRKDICETDTPQFEDVGNDHFSLCHFARQLKLHGVKTR
jgi:peptide/nickel transport system ATP-binding protein